MCQGAGDLHMSYIKSIKLNVRELSIIESEAVFDALFRSGINFENPPTPALAGGHKAVGMLG